MPWREMSARDSAAAWLPEVSGILTGQDILATGCSIAATQQRDGAIGWPDGHVDAWNHVECAMALSACGLRPAARRAYDWLRATQRQDGSWPKTSTGGMVTDHAAESNQVAYPAVGVWHEFLVTGDEEFAAAMWPTVRRATDYVLGLQTARGELAWERTAAGTAAGYALLAGCSSAHQSLRCGCSRASSTCGIRWAGTGPAGSTRTRRTFLLSRAAGRPPRSSWPPTRCPARPAARVFSVTRLEDGRSPSQRTPPPVAAQPMPSPVRSSTRSEP